MAQSRTRKKIGLALGGGAAKGLAHMGVLDVFEREGIPIDVISGTSIGAIIGAFYSYTKDLKLMKDVAAEVGHKRAYYFSDVGLPKTGLLRLARLEKLLKTVIGGVHFKDLQIPFSCVAVDMDSGLEVTLNDGPVWDAVRASSSIPVIISPTIIGGRYLLDGGLLNPLPVSAARRMGADIVIAVNVGGTNDNSHSGSPNIFTIVMKTIRIAGNRDLTIALREAHMVIEPQVDSIGYTDFHLAEQAFSLGQSAAKRILPEINRRLAIA